MPGKTISAYTDEETAQLAEQIARMEHRNVSQIASAALAFYVRLPAQAHDALRFLIAIQSREDEILMIREVTRAISNAAADAAHRSLEPALRERYGDTLRTEEEIEAEAVRLTRQREPTIVRRGTRQVADSPSRSKRQ